jgi:hypothetical protein
MINNSNKINETSSTNDIFFTNNNGRRTIITNLNRSENSGNLKEYKFSSHQNKNSTKNTSISRPIQLINKQTKNID